MDWNLFNIIGTIAFAFSGAVIAMEEEYDLLGVLVLGFATAFGGGILRNLLIGVPVTNIWGQSTLFIIAFISILFIFFLPNELIHRWRNWNEFFDAIGLSAFAIQGAFYAYSMHHPLSAIITASVLTGIGGGIIRDLLAHRKPVVLKDEIYAAWAILIGLLVGLNIVQTSWQIYLLFVSILILRMVSIYYHWRLPKRSLTFSHK